LGRSVWQGLAYFSPCPSKGSDALTSFIKGIEVAC
jgi:hypothetical protein